MLPIYPSLAGLAYPLKWIPRFFNMATKTTASGADVDLPLWPYPLHDFELQYEFLRNGSAMPEFQTLQGFISDIGGTSGRFLFLNPWDNAIAGQAIGTGDGSTTTFTLVRTFGAGGFGGTEPVGYVNRSTLNVYDNGTLKAFGTDYVFDGEIPCQQAINFATPPAAGHAITADISYWYYCKFAENQQELAQQMATYWSAPKVQIRSCRPAACADAFSGMKWQTVQVVNVDSVTNAGGSLSNSMSVGITVSGFSSGDLLRLTLPLGQTYTAWNYQDDGTPNRWVNEFDVVPDSTPAASFRVSQAGLMPSSGTHYPDGYATAEIAREAFGVHMITGASAYTFWIIDTAPGGGSGTFNNTGGVSVLIEKAV